MRCSASVGHFRLHCSVEKPRNVIRIRFILLGFNEKADCGTSPIVFPHHLLASRTHYSAVGHCNKLERWSDALYKWRTQVHVPLGRGTFGHPTCTRLDTGPRRPSQKRNRLLFHLAEGTESRFQPSTLSYEREMM